MRAMIQKYRTVIKYLMSGAVTFVVDYVTLVACYYVLGLPLWLATSLGYLAGLCVSFYLNRRWVYGSRGRERRAIRQLVEYAVLLVFNYFFTVLTVQMLDNFHIPPAISKLGVTALIVCWNYIIYSRIIFRSNHRVTF